MSGDWIHTVYRRTTGNWANEIGPREHVCSVHATREEAVQRGRALALAAETIHVIHEIDDTISSRQSYGNDPSARDSDRDLAS